MMKLRLRDKLYYNDYKGLSVQQILDADPYYIQFLINTDKIRLSFEAYGYYRDKLSEKTSIISTTEY